VERNYLCSVAMLSRLHSSQRHTGNDSDTGEDRSRDTGLPTVVEACSVFKAVEYKITAPQSSLGTRIRLPRALEYGVRDDVIRIC
jgi:hypothetical protein